MNMNRIPEKQRVEPREHLARELARQRAKNHARSKFWLFWILVERMQNTYMDLLESFRKAGVAGICRQISLWYEDVHQRSFLGMEAKWLNRHVGNPDTFGFCLLLFAFTGVMFVCAITRLN